MENRASLSSWSSENELGGGEGKGSSQPLAALSTCAVNTPLPPIPHIVVLGMVLTRRFEHSLQN